MAKSNKRRAAGEGTLRWRAKDQAWEWRTPHGFPITKSFSSKEQKAVLEKARAFMDQWARGVRYDLKDLTLSEYLRRWLRDSVSGSVKQTTYDGYERTIRLYIEPEIGGLNLRDVMPAHIQALYRTKLDTGLSNRTVRYIYQTLNPALKQAVKWGLIERNPVEATRPPRKIRKKLTVFTPDQAAAFFEACREDRLGPLYVVAGITGMREGELLGLSWTDLDLAEPRPLLRITHQLVRSTKGTSIEPSTKTDEDRAVPLAKLAVDALRVQRKTQVEERLKAGSAWRETGLVFTTPIGTWIDPSNLTQYHLKPFLARHDLPKIRFHDLRHSLATILAILGAHPVEVQGWFGHADIQTTLNLYTHYFAPMQDSAVERLDGLYGDLWSRAEGAAPEAEKDAP